MKQSILPTILLTGANGFLGSYLLEALLHLGYPVVVLKRSTSNLWRITHLVGLFKSYDIDTENLEKAFREQHIDCVIHTACHYGRNDDSIYKVVESNVMFGLRVLDACLENNTRSFINTDTFFNANSSIQQHLNIYTQSKRQFVEWLCQKKDKIQVINLKLQHIYGGKDDATKFIPWIIFQLKAGVPEINLTKGDQLRDFIYISDVVSSYIIVLEKLSFLPNFDEFDVGTGTLTSVKSFLLNLKLVYEREFGNVSTVLNFGSIVRREDEIMSVDVDNKGLINLGWMPKVKSDDGLMKAIKFLSAK
jgi:CDP-paratose synthetase